MNTDIRPIHSSEPYDSDGYADEAIAISDTDIAIVGMAGCFPGAASVDEFWCNLRDGKEAVQFFSDEELAEAGVPSLLFNNPAYVKAGAVLEDIEYFDANFFGFSPREAEIMDPQHRLFLEQAWSVLEHAGYSTDQYEGAIAVYAGVGVNDYLLSCLYPHLQQAGSSMGYQAIIRNDKDFLPTLASYKLNLKGPSVSVQTACSTSLVAVHMACQSLLNGECDMALAGGSAISVDQKQGYLYEEGMIMSPDGHCRAFDAKAQGTVGGSAVATVLLKRLADAVDDGDTIHAVIKGSAINNDGDDKVGYTAPSVTGQAAVIAEAQAIAGVDPSTISYVEAHGTGTILGDPIELSALTQAFQSDSDEPGETHPPQSPLAKGGNSGPPPLLSRSVSEGRRGVRGGDQSARSTPQYCAIGSLKTNMGHLDTVAGVAGLIKTALALKHQQIPPSLHFDAPNPAINFADSPFFVNTQLTPWQRNGTPRRAGVSSFGIGGTNAHAVLEEAPTRSPSGPSRSRQLLTLSAKTSTALATIAGNLSEHLSKQIQTDPDLSLADVAYTLNRGRKGLECRQTVVTGTVEEAIAHLQTLATSTTAPTRVLDGLSVTFMFSGQGSQYVNMGRELYDTEPLFQDTIDQGAEHLLPILGQDIRDSLYPPTTASEEQLEQCRQQLQQTAIAQPALFIVEYALAQLWMTWGVQPQMMIGHSIGEYVAACLAGVFSLEDALTLVAKRGQLMQSLPAGSMMAIALPVEDVSVRLESYPDLSLATVNGPSCVVSGPTPSIEALHESLTQSLTQSGDSVQCRLLHTSHGFHSAMMEPILPLFTQAVQSITLSSPTRPYISNVTGTWITEDQATNPDYWAQHLRQTVYFAPGLAQILQDPAVALLEVGPGKTLSRFAQQHPALEKNHRVFTSLRHPKETTGDVAMVLNTLGQLWSVGATVDWQAVYQDERRHRLPLPTYPFERQRYWIDAPDASEMAMGNGLNLQNFATVPRKPNVADWLYVPSWQRSPLPPTPTNDSTMGDRWLVFQDPWGIMAQLVKRLEHSGQQVWTVDLDTTAHPGWTTLDNNAFTLNPHEPGAFDQLVQHLCDTQQRPNRIVHGWSLTPLVDSASTLDVRYTEQQQVLGLHTLLSLAQSLGKQASFPDTELITVVNGVHEVTGAEDLIPANSTAIAPTKVLPLEYPHLKCRSIDIELPQADIGLHHVISSRLIDQLWSECLMSPDQIQDIQVAYRGPHRWVPTYATLPAPSLEETNNETEQTPTFNLRLRPQGVYLITGGMGGIGLSLAQGLSKAVQARLILVKRSDFLPKEQWQTWLDSHDETDETAQTIRRLQTIEADGGAVRVLAADVTNLAQMKQVVQTAEAEFGSIDGVLHCAGLADFAGVVQGRTREATDHVLASKVQGTLVLQHLFNQHPLDFFLLSSSLNTTIYKALFGQVGYCAANDFLDAFATYNTAVNNTFTVTVNWTAWLEVGMAAKAHANDAETTAGLGDALPIDDIILGITPTEGQSVFQQILNQPHPRVVVSTQDLPRLLHQQAAFDPHEFLQQIALQEPDADAPRYPRPELSVDYVAPKTSLEILLAESWQGFLGLETVGIDDNFFDLGGDSLSSLGLITQLQHKLSIELPSNLLLEAPTISQLVNHLKQTYRGAIDDFFQSLETGDDTENGALSEDTDDITTDETSALDPTPLNPPTSSGHATRKPRGETPSPLQGEGWGGVIPDLETPNDSQASAMSSTSFANAPTPPSSNSPEPSPPLEPSALSLCLIRMRKGEPEQSPLFFAHPIGGGVACYTTLLRHLNPDRPFYGLRALGMDDDRPPHRDLKAMARDYIAAIKTVQPEGPYKIGGWSMGGVIAYEMAQQLGDEVASVVLVDSPAPVQQQNPAPLLTQLFVFGRSLGLADVQTRLTIGSERFQTLPLNEQLDRLLRQGVAAKVLPKSFELERMMQLFEVFQSNDYALKQYVAAQDITNAPMLFIRAQDSSSSITSDMDELGWQQLVNGQGSPSSKDRLQFTQSPGDHYSMVTKTHVQVLGDRIETFLRSVRRHSDPSKGVTPPQPLMPSVPLGMPSRDSGS